MNEYFTSVYLILCGAALGLFVDAQAAHADGYLYVHTNQVENAIIQYARNADGSLTEVATIPTGGKGTGAARPLHGGEPGPDPIVSAGSIILNGNHSRLFVVNAGDGSVSAFSISEDGAPALLDTEASNGSVPNTLAYNDETDLLYVGHLYGPQHVRLMDFADGDLTLREGGYTLDTETVAGRLISQLLLSPEQDYLIGMALIQPRADGSGIEPVTENGLAYMKLDTNGVPETVRFTDAGGPEPFSSIFLDDGSNRFITTYGEDNSVTLNHMSNDGIFSKLSYAKADDSVIDGRSFELCWVALSPDNKYAYVSSFGTGDLISFAIGEDGLELAQQGIGHVPAANGFMAQAKVPSSAAVDVWASSDGYLYQIYGAAGKLGAFRMTEDGGLEEIAIYDVPVNSTQGITGY